MKFTYEAMRANGEAIDGEVDALSYDDAVTQIRSKGYFPTRVKEMKVKKVDTATEMMAEALQDKPDEQAVELPPLTEYQKDFVRLHSKQSGNVNITGFIFAFYFLLAAGLISQALWPYMNPAALNVLSFAYFLFMFWQFLCLVAFIALHHTWTELVKKPGKLSKESITALKGSTQMFASHWDGKKVLGYVLHFGIILGAVMMGWLITAGIALMIWGVYWMIRTSLKTVHEKLLRKLTP
jgi:hypothetical protein